MNHKWLWIPMNSEFMGMINGYWDQNLGRWRCQKCSAVTKGSFKPKTSRDYRKEGIEKDCIHELVRNVMEA